MFNELFKKKNYSLDASIVDFKCKFNRNGEGCVSTVIFSDGYKYSNSTLYNVSRLRINYKTTEIKTYITNDIKDLIIHFATCEHYKACTGLDPISIIEPKEVEKLLSISECVKIANEFAMAENQEFTKSEGFMDKLKFDKKGLIISPVVSDKYAQLVAISSMVYCYKYNNQKSYEQLIPELKKMYELKISKYLVPSEKEISEFCNEYWRSVKRDYHYNVKTTSAKYTRSENSETFGDRITGFNDLLLGYASKYLDER